MIEFIKSGLGFKPDPWELRKMAVGSSMFLVMGLPGILMKGAGIVLFCLMAVIAVASIVAVFIVSAKLLTVKNRLIIQLIISLDFCLQFALIQTIAFLLAYGFHGCLILLYLPIIINPLLFGLKNAKMLKADNPLPEKKDVQGKAGCLAISSAPGMIGMGIAAFLKDKISQNAAILIVIIGILFVNSAMSFGLLAIQRLYYLAKYEKLGIFPDSFFNGDPLTEEHSSAPPVH